MMKTAKTAPAAAPLIVNPMSAPTIYADGCIGFVDNFGNLRLTFATLSADHSGSGGPPAQVVCVRLVLPSDGAENLTEMLRSHFQAKNAVRKLADVRAPDSPQ